MRIVILRYTSLLFFLTMCSCNFCSKHGVEYKDMNAMQKLGYPNIEDTIPSEILERLCFSLSYNYVTRQPNWVMWELKGEHVMKRKDGVWNEYREDMALPKQYRSTLNDYAYSGYDRGHMCPGGDCNWSDEGRDETFLLSNMCPQNPSLNRGDWKEIEIACRNWAIRYGKIFIVCGPIFLKSQKHQMIGENMIPVPEAFFKVVLCPDSVNPKGIGFICRNTEGNRKKDFYVNSIKQVERVTGYEFFPYLDKTIKEQVYYNDCIEEW